MSAAHHPTPVDNDDHVALRMVDSRWAMTTLVRPFHRGVQARWTATSDSESRCAVASSYDDPAAP